MMPLFQLKAHNKKLNIFLLILLSNIDIKFKIIQPLTNENYGRPSPPKIQGCQIDQQIQRWCKDQLQDSIANKGMAWPNYRRFSFPS